MHDLSNSLPDHLPGIRVAFALKQCLGKKDLLLTLLDKFWEDYEDSAQRLEAEDLESAHGQTLLHDLEGAAANLGLTELSQTSQDLRRSLKSTGRLSEEQRGRFHMELEKVGRSIKTLDSALQS